MVQPGFWKAQVSISFPILFVQFVVFSWEIICQIFFLFVTSDFQKNVLHSLEVIKFRLQTQSERIEMINTKLDGLSSGDIQRAVSIAPPVRLPLKSMDDLKSLEDKITSDETFRNQLVSIWSISSVKLK